MATFFCPQGGRCGEVQLQLFNVVTILRTLRKNRYQHNRNVFISGVFHLAIRQVII